MSVRVAAVNTPALVALGLSQALAASGYVIEPIEDPKHWARSNPTKAMLVGVRGDTDLDLLSDLSSSVPSLVLVALVEQAYQQKIGTCFSAGARACASIDWTAEDVALALDAGMRGLALLPAAMARDLTRSRSKIRYAEALTASQRSWLRLLATGTTIADLAANVGFSERETYRRLRQIYRTMGVRDRTEALIVASASGILDGV